VAGDVTICFLARYNRAVAICLQWNFLVALCVAIWIWSGKGSQCGLCRREGVGAWKFWGTRENDQETFEVS
jgi:hypothetical protein